MSRKLFILFLGLIIGLGLVFRLVNLSSLPIFADESIYVRWSQVMKNEPSLRFLPLSDGKQPLFMWGTIVFLKFFSDPLLAGRFLSSLTIIGSILGVSLLSYLLFKSPRLTLISALVFSLIPYSVFFDRLALADSLLSMFIIWGIALHVIAIKNQRLDFAMLSGFAFGFAWLTKSPAQIYVLMLPLLILLSPKLSKIKILKLLSLNLVTFIIAFGMYNILRLGPEFHMIAIRNLDYIFPLSEIIKHPLDPLVPHIKDSFNFYFYLLTPIGLLFAFWGLFDIRKNHLASRFILGAYFLLPIIALSAIAKAYTARYILFTLPYAVILIAHAVEHLGERTKKHILVYLATILVVIPSIYFNYLLITNPDRVPLPRVERSGYLEEWTAGHGIKQVSEVIKARSVNGPIVVGSEGFFGTPFSGLEMYLNGYSNVRVVGVGVYIDSVNEKLVSATKDNQVFLVVNSSRFHGDLDKMKNQLKLLGAYPKAQRPDGTRESLLFFEVLKQ